MKWFKKQADYKLSNRYAGILRQKWADKMNDLTKDLSKKSLIILLILFVTGAGIFFGSLLYNSLKMEVSGAFDIIQISKTLPLKENRIDSKMSNDSAGLKRIIIKSNNKK
ncbi:hypothetical protein KHA90_07985 [Flavobacterium psychroterrae]|uniref:Uncharacterized protein n=1 Tax=Flavobacterium psychroterrae TaxID=2133767 RepID=A0ABS5PAT7_9FLAO|nr:hypothetical protein [Flavobacterium psychroterrae]MBS7230960.1 hypothetical protein [Flavobacterium psychroterrae]